MSDISASSRPSHTQIGQAKNNHTTTRRKKYALKMLYLLKKHMFSYKYIAFTIYTLLFCSLTGHSQQAPQKPLFWDKVQFGGSLGVNFGNGFFIATVAPSAIYNFNEFFALGTGLNATFNNEKDVLNTTILGANIIGLSNPYPQLQLSAELEQLNVNQNFDAALGIEDNNFWTTALFLGAGFRNGNITFGLRYNVLFDEDESIYADPLIPFVRVYF